MVDFLGGLLTVAGGGAEGVGDSMKENALEKMKQDALAIRDKRIAKLAGDNQKASDMRESAQRDKEYSRGLLDEEKNYQRGIVDEEKTYQRRKTETSATAQAADQVAALESLGMETELAKETVKKSLMAVDDETLSNAEKASTIRANFFKGTGETTSAEELDGRQKRYEAFMRRAGLERYIAGPGGGMEGKPVGLVHFGWCIGSEPASCDDVVFPGDRNEVRQRTVLHALEGILIRLDALS